MIRLGPTQLLADLYHARRQIQNYGLHRTYGRGPRPPPKLLLRTKGTGVRLRRWMRVLQNASAKCYLPLSVRLEQLAIGKRQAYSLTYERPS